MYPSVTLNDVAKHHSWKIAFEIYIALCGFFVIKESDQNNVLDFGQNPFVLKNLKGTVFGKDCIKMQASFKLLCQKQSFFPCWVEQNRIFVSFIFICVSDA